MRTIIIFLTLAANIHAATFTYDDAGQLIAESYPNGAHAFYEYDDIGNPLARTTIAPNSNPQADLTITSAFSQDPATVDSPLNLTITVTNNGPDSATDVTIDEVLPADFAPETATATQGNAALDGQSLKGLLGTVANGHSVTITVEGSALASGTITHISDVTSPEEIDISNNASTSNTVIDDGIDLAFSFIQHGPTPSINTGSTLIFIARAINNGPSEATNVIHTFTLPPEVTFLFAAPGTGTSTHNAGVVTCNLGNIASGAEVETILFANPTSATGTFITTTNLVADQVDLTPFNNSDQFETEVLAPTLIVTNTNDSGSGSLRQAIVDANANPDADVIGFDLPQNIVQTITPLNNFPALTEPVLIDGFSAAAGLVEINGTNMNTGFIIESSDVGLRALVINRCGTDGITARSNTSSRLTDITIQGCIIGLNANGDTDLGNNNHGIEFEEVDDSSIGGSEFWMANTISGNNDHGIFIDDSCNNLTIAGNRIGLDITAEFDLGNTDDGIIFLGSNSLIGGTGPSDGNIISGNGDFGLELSGAGNRVFQNCIGTDFDGLDAIPNGTANSSRAGLLAISFSEDNPNIIGGFTASERNLISGNQNRNVHLLPGVRCIGNFIGPDITGNSLLNNRPFAHGVELNNGATLGGILPGEGNVISGNSGSGVILDDFLPGDSFILGNKIGLGFDGNTDLGNNDSGVVINNEAGTKHIGLDIAGAGNIISGNADEGILSDQLFGEPEPANVIIQGNKIGTNAEGTAAVPNDDQGISIRDGINFTIGSAIPAGGNLISGNIDEGINTSDGVTDIHIEGNRIGTDATGTFPIGNLEEGINSNADNVQIIDNLVSGNGDLTASFFGREEGIATSGDNTLIQGNQVGTDQTGTFAIPNASGGIIILGGSDILVGGAFAGQGNLISGNENPNLEVITNATIAGNIIGPNLTANAPLTGTLAATGVQLSSSNGTFGLPGLNGGNVVSANDGNGIRLSGDNWTLQNNRIGTTDDGLSALANSGVGLDASSGADGGVIKDNLISGNLGDGILLAGEDLEIQNNAIGSNKGGSALGNGGNGVRSTTIFGINLLGGTDPGDGNTIAYNNLAGVRNEGDGAFDGADLTILGNNIFANGALGIDLTNDVGDLDGITSNDLDDTDEGTNGLQNAPIIVTAGNSITGTLNSEPNQTYRIEFFANNTADPSGHGEGEIFLGFLDTTTDANGDAAFTFNSPTAPANGQFITATATNPDNQTSEFGLALIVTGGSGFSDIDGDGISDAYELEHFGSETAGDPNEDADGDGQNNLAEFIALTDPNDPLSLLTLEIRIEGENVIISLNSKSGRTYQLHASEGLEDFPALGDAVAGDNNIIEFIDAIDNRHFYRISVSQ